MNKFTLQALALTGILAISGLPAFAADMAPASPAPGASITTDSKAKVAAPSTSTVDNKAQTSVNKPAIEKDKAATSKKLDKDSKNISKDKKKVQQTAVHPDLPAANGSVGSSTSVGTGTSAGVNGSAGAAVKH